MRRLKLLCFAASVLLLACSPALDWRDVRPEGSGLTVQFPCKPTTRTRSAMLSGAPVPMTLLSCEAGGVTFALSHADLGDPAQVTDALVELRSALAGNLQAAPLRSVAFDLTGMTPNPQAIRIAFAGRLPDGTAVEERAVLFTRGSVVYQAVVLGVRLEDAAAGTFFESLRLL